MISSKEIGKIGENLAVEHLKHRNYKILERNYKKRWLGEIDIIAQKSGILIFVEVKALIKSKNLPEDSINYFKKQKLIKTAKFYLMEKKILSNIKWQIDVIAIDLDEEGKLLDLRHIENAIYEY